jgi:hypothetical protein
LGSAVATTAANSCQDVSQPSIDGGRRPTLASAALSQVIGMLVDSMKVFFGGEVWWSEVIGNFEEPKWKWKCKWKMHSG